MYDAFQGSETVCATLADTGTMPWSHRHCESLQRVVPACCHHQGSVRTQPLVFLTLQDSIVSHNAALGPAAGGAPGSGVGGGLFLQPMCLGGAGCKATFALLSNTLLDHNTASQVWDF